MGGGLIDPYAWKLEYDEFGSIVVVPVENPPNSVVQKMGEPPWAGGGILRQVDPGNDPEYERAKVARLAR
jgi:hypothetical protein